MCKEKVIGASHSVLNRAYFWKKCTALGVMGECRFLMAHSSIENMHVLAYVQMSNGQVIEVPFGDIKFII